MVILVCCCLNYKQILINILKESICFVPLYKYRVTQIYHHYSQETYYILEKSGTLISGFLETLKVTWCTGVRTYLRTYIHTYLKYPLPLEIDAILFADLGYKLHVQIAGKPLEYHPLKMEVHSCLLYKHRIYWALYCAGYQLNFVLGPNLTQLLFLSFLCIYFIFQSYFSTTCSLCPYFFLLYQYLSLI